MSRNAAQTILELDQLVDQLTAAGITPAKPYQEALDRWHDFAALEPHHAFEAELAGAVAHGKATSLPNAQLLALTYAAINPSPAIAAEVRNRVAAAALPTLREAASAHGGAAYDKLRKDFNDTAEKLRGALLATDPDARAESILTADEPTRLAWGTIPVLAARLDSLLGTMRMAAELTGRKPEPLDMALTIDPQTPRELRRHVWEAWDNTKASRARRWKALAALDGVTITARPLDGLTAYRRPQPLETRYRRGELGLRPYQHDPELGQPEEGTAGLPTGLRI